MNKGKKEHKTTIGGQAVIEGVMMKGVSSFAMAVRKPDGEIDVEIWENPGGAKAWYKKTPFVRGIFNFVDMLLVGYRCLMKSAEKAGLDEIEEPSALEKKLMKVFGDKFSSVLSGFSMVLGVILAVGLFMVLPTYIGLLANFLGTALWGAALPAFGLSLVEGAAKILLFILYLALMSRLEDIKRLFAYHGAEHKSIACYEAGEELTVENIRKQTRFHPRCGTSFLLIVLILSILVFSVVTWSSPVIRVVLKLLLLPVVMGIAYELIKLAGRYDNPVTRVLSAPGLWLQRLTTAEPADDQIEVAIASLKPVLPKEGEDDRW